MYLVLCGPLCIWSSVALSALTVTCGKLLQDPMVTSQGYIFSREAILEYFLTQKELKKKELKEWEQERQGAADLVRASLFVLLLLGSCTMSTYSHRFL
jgi:hypothetical protein